VAALFASASLPSAARPAVAPPATAATAVPQTWRSEAFAEDIFDLEHPRPPAPSLVASAWLFCLAPVLVLMLGVAFAVVPPLA
jgi:hypothetical protein